jgi:hypothetical protein
MIFYEMTFDEKMLDKSVKKGISCQLRGAAP